MKPSRHTVTIPLAVSTSNTGRLLDIYTEPHQLNEDDRQDRIDGRTHTFSELAKINLRIQGEHAYAAANKALNALEKEHLRLDEQKMYPGEFPKNSVIDGESAELGIALALLMGASNSRMSAVIATGAFHRNPGNCLINAQVAKINNLQEKLEAVLIGAENAKWSPRLFFIPSENVDADPALLQSNVVLDLKKQHIDVVAVDSLRAAAKKLNLQLNPVPGQFSWLFNRKPVFGALALSALLMASQVKIPRNHPIDDGVFNQITHYTVLDKLKGLAEKLVSYRYQKPLSIMIVYSEKAPYEQAIAHSFLEHLGNKIWNLEQAIQSEPFYNPDGTEKNMDEWMGSINRIIEQTPSRKVDYFITTGTFVTKAIRDHNFIGRYHAKGLVFLGVTDPVKAKLVESLDNRHEDANITGVRYGSGNEEDYGNMIGSLFPAHQKLVFVYDINTPQDRYVAENLTHFTVNKDPRFELRPKNGTVNLDDLNPKQPNSPQEVYFAWYGLDNVLRDTNKEDGVAALKTKWVIPSTYSTSNLDRAGIIVSVSDQEIGRLGAEIVFKSYLNPDLKLGHEPIGTTPFKFWLDCNVIRRNKEGLRLAAPIAKAEQVLNKDICPSVM